MASRRPILDSAARSLGQGRLAQAQEQLAQILRDAPDDVDALLLDGELRIRLGDAGTAIATFGRAARLRPQVSQTHRALAEACRLAADWPAMEQACREWLRRFPGLAVANFLLGETRREMGDDANAIDAYRLALETDPMLLPAHNNAAGLLLRNGRFEEAVPHLHAALAVDPTIASLYCNLGVALVQTGRTQEAIDAYAKAVGADPLMPGAHLDLGVLLHAVGRLDEALRHLDEAARLAPGTALAHANLGTVLKDLGFTTEAVQACIRSVRVDPNCLLAWSNLIVSLGYDFGHGHQERADKWLRRYGERWANVRRRHLAPRDPSGRPIRLGYVSADFRDHATAYFFEPTLEAHDRERFMVFCYDCGEAPDHVTERLRSTRAEWRACHGRSDDELAAMVERDRIDILVDLMGHTARNRLSLFATKPAPVQVTWLGWPGSPGLAAIDYRISDPWLCETASDCAYHPERLIALPHTWLCFRPDSSAPPASPVPSSRGAPLTFGSFNNVYKLGPAVLATWSRLLSALPESRLVLMGVPQGVAQARIRQALSENGVIPDRVEIVPPCRIARFFELHAHVDIALDPFPFNGGTTTLHSLWLGVPVITLAGRSHAGRMGYSILRNLGLDDLIAYAPDEYVLRAVALALNPQRLSHLRSTLREMLSRSPLMDEKGFVLALEAAYVQSLASIAGASAE